MNSEENTSAGLGNVPHLSYSFFWTISQAWPTFDSSNWFGHLLGRAENTAVSAVVGRASVLHKPQGFIAPEKKRPFQKEMASIPTIHFQVCEMIAFQPSIFELLWVSGFFLIRFNFKKNLIKKTFLRHLDGNQWEPMPTPKPALLQIRPSIGQGIIVIITYNHQGAPVLLRPLFLDRGYPLRPWIPRNRMFITILKAAAKLQKLRKLRTVECFLNDPGFFHGEKCCETASCCKPLTCPWYPPGTQLVHFFGHQEYLLYHPGSWNNRNSMVYPPLSLLKPPTFRISRWCHLTPVTIEKKCHERVSSSWWFRPVWKILLKLDHFPK